MPQKLCAIASCSKTCFLNPIIWGPEATFAKTCSQKAGFFASFQKKCHFTTQAVFKKRLCCCTESCVCFKQQIFKCKHLTTRRNDLKHLPRESKHSWQVFQNTWLQQNGNLTSLGPVSNNLQLQVFCVQAPHRWKESSACLKNRNKKQTRFILRWLQKDVKAVSKCFQIDMKKGFRWCDNNARWCQHKSC